MVESEHKIVLEVQRINGNNLYWLEDSSSHGTTLRGVINISKRDKDENASTEYTVLNNFNINDAIYISIVAESKLIGDKQ